MRSSCCRSANRPHTAAGASAPLTASSSAAPAAARYSGTVRACSRRTALRICRMPSSSPSSSNASSVSLALSSGSKSASCASYMALCTWRAREAESGWGGGVMTDSVARPSGALSMPGCGRSAAGRVPPTEAARPTWTSLPTVVGAAPVAQAPHNEQGTGACVSAFPGAPTTRVCHWRARHTCSAAASLICSAERTACSTSGACIGVDRSLTSRCAATQREGERARAQQNEASGRRVQKGAACVLGSRWRAAPHRHGAAAPVPPTRPPRAPRTARPTRPCPW
eukprot:5805733-Prymnesium_polylepis.3